MDRKRTNEIMQSVPYFPTNFLSSPYPTTTATTTTTSPPENGSTVMTMTNPPLLSSPHGMTEQTIPLNGSSAEGTKRNQVKNACSKFTLSKKIFFVCLMTT